MKKKLLFILSIVLSIQASAQWAVKYSGLQTEERGITHMSIPSPDVSWGLAWDGSANPVNIHEFTRSTDGGETWVQGTIPNLSSDYLPASISAVSADSAWVVFSDTINGGGAIYRTVNGGQSWQHQSTAQFNGTFSFANFVHFWNSNEGVAVGDPTIGDQGYYYFEIYITTDGGDTWTRVPRLNFDSFTNTEMAMVSRYTVSGDVIWFPTTQGNVMRSSDRGNTWKLLNTPLTGSGIFADLAFRDSLNGLAVARANANPYSADGGIYKTSDGGASWTQVVNSTAGGIGMKNAVEYVPGTSAGYVITGSENPPYGSAFTQDGGLTWTNIDTIKHHKVYFHDFNTGYSGGFVSGGQGGVFKWIPGLLVNVMKQSIANNELRIYPNPSRGIVYLQGGFSDNSVVEIFDLTGRIVHEQKVSGNTEKTLLNLAGLPTGIYTARIGSTSNTIKFIIR